MNRATYVALCRRSGDWWAIEVPAVDGVFTQSRRLIQAEAMARDAIATMLTIAPDSFDVEVSPRLPARVERAVDHARSSRAQAERTSAEAAAASRHAVAEFAELGLTVRDIGAVLDVSFQRAQQLLASSRAQSLHRTDRQASCAAS